MTKVYFVRHAQPEHSWKEDRTRPLTDEGKKDSSIVFNFFKDKNIDKFYCSPYKRSVDTIIETAFFSIKILLRMNDFENVKKDRTAINTECTKSVGRTKITMKTAASLLQWCKIAIWKRCMRFCQITMIKILS